MLRICLLSLFVVVLHAVDSPDRRIIAALDALATSADAAAIHRATNELLNSAPMNNQTLENATWVALGKRYLPLAKKIPLWERTRLVGRLVRRAPPAHQANALKWSLDGWDAVLDLAEQRIDDQAAEMMKLAASNLLPIEGESWASWSTVPWTELHDSWMAAFTPAYQPIAKRLEDLATKWNPSKHPDFGSALGTVVQRHPACTSLIRILMKRCTGTKEVPPLHAALALLSKCQEPVPEAPAVIQQAVKTFKQDLALTDSDIQLWRGDPVIGAALIPLMLAPGDKDFARYLAGEQAHDLWRVVLPPVAERRALVKRTIDGLEAGLEVPTNALTVQLAFHILDFPDGYAGMGDADLQRRLTALLDGPNDIIRLLAFNLIGHLAGRDGIDAAYAVALPQVHDLLMPDSPREQRLRGIPQDPRWMFREVSGLLAATRFRLTLCQLPLTGPDRARVCGWVGETTVMTLPVAAWLVRTTSTGEHPLAGLAAAAWFLDAWPQWSEPTKSTSTPPDWRTNLGNGLMYLQEFPDWTDGPAVIDAALSDPQEFDRLVSFVSADERENTKALRRVFHDHAGLRAFTEKKTTALEKKGRETVDPDWSPISSWQLAMMWGHALGQPERAAALLALRYPEILGNAGFNPGLTLPLADIARWSPNHPLLDAQEQRWRSQLPIAPRRAFQIWCLAVLRGRDPGVFPATAWLDHLLFKDGSDFTSDVMKRHPALFARHLKVLRTPCPPRMTELDSLAVALAMVQAAADSAP